MPAYSLFSVKKYRCYQTTDKRWVAANLMALITINRIQKSPSARA